jgi:hypothetical protein
VGQRPNEGRSPNEEKTFSARQSRASHQPAKPVNRLFVQSFGSDSFASNVQRSASSRMGAKQLLAAVLLALIMHDALSTAG